MPDMPRVAASIMLSDAERTVLRQWSRGRRQSPTVFSRMPRSAAMAVFSQPSAARSTILARRTRRVGVRRPLDHCRSTVRSASDSMMDAATRGISGIETCPSLNVIYFRRTTLVPRNVATLVDPPHVRKFELKPLTPDELRDFLDAVRGNRFEALLILTVTTGLRRGEVLGLQKDDLDLKQGQLRVRHALQRVKGHGLQLVETKSAAGRRPLKLSKLAVQALTRYRLRQLEERLAAGSRWTESGFIFTCRKGTPLEPATVIRNYHRVLKSAGLRHQRFHDLRHANASLLLAEGVHPRVVMEMLGHSQISLTLNTYSHVIPSLQDDAVARVDAALGGKRK